MIVSQCIATRVVTVRLEPSDPTSADRLPIDDKRTIGAFVREGCEVLLYACNGRLMRHWAKEMANATT